MRLIDADALIDTIAIIAKKFARSDAQTAVTVGISRNAEEATDER